VPPELLSLIRRSGILLDRQFDVITGKVNSGEYPSETRALAERLVSERILTEFQANRLLRNKVHGLLVGRYVILDHLGTGGRGRVFKAQHRLMGRVAALKVIAPQIAKRASSIARFYREMRLIGRLDHPNVVRAFDADQAGDLLYIVMEYVAGRSLDRIVEEKGRLPAARVANYMAQAAMGLAHAHERGIVHRDVKPPNLLLSDEGQVKVLDLGLSALTEADSAASFATAAGLIVGTVHYMSPEQAMAMNIDGRSDLFSLGCTMYYLLSALLPFPGESIAECLTLRIKGDPAPITRYCPDLSPRLIQVMDKLMARRPEDRFQTAAEAALALQTAAIPEAADLSAPQPIAPTEPEPSVSTVEQAADASLAVPTDVAQPGEFLIPAPLTWSFWRAWVAAQPRAIVLSMALFALGVFGLGFALGALAAGLGR